MEDRKHLRRYTDLEKQELIDQWKQSGKSKLIFCKERGVGYYSLLEWIRGGKRKPSPKAKSSFIPLKIKSSPHSIFATVTLKNGATVSLHQRIEASYLMTLLKA